LGAVLSAFLEKTGLMRRAADEQIRDAWPAAVGEAVAPLTTLVGFRRGVLTVAVAGAALRQELASFRAAEVLAALNARLSGVRVDKLKVKLTSGG
jgi:predicted nucleic acid-binding Zn ribbon protein